MCLQPVCLHGSVLPAGREGDSITPLGTYVSQRTHTHSPYQALQSLGHGGGKPLLPSKSRDEEDVLRSRGLVRAVSAACTQDRKTALDTPAHATSCDISNDVCRSGRSTQTNLRSPLLPFLAPFKPASFSLFFPLSPPPPFPPSLTKLLDGLVCTPR